MLPQDLRLHRANAVDCENGAAITHALWLGPMLLAKRLHSPKLHVPINDEASESGGYGPYSSSGTAQENASYECLRVVRSNSQVSVEST